MKPRRLPRADPVRMRATATRPDLLQRGLAAMPSPFPGMDPYIEACGLWEDFHAKLIGEMERALAPLLPERYVVRVGERSYIVLSPPEGPADHPMLPDVSVTARR